MKCNNCQSEWISRVVGTITRCPFCGHDLTRTASPVVGQKTGFADDLRSKTKTKEQLAAERELAIKRQIQDNVKSVVEHVKRDCQLSAGRGERELVESYRISWGSERAVRKETSALVTEALQKEGFRKVICRRGSSDSYLRVLVRW